MDRWKQADVLEFQNDYVDDDERLKLDCHIISLIMIVNSCFEESFDDDDPSIQVFWQIFVYILFI